MTSAAIAQLVAVIIGGLLATMGGFVSTVLVAHHQRAVTSRSLALAFKGEISALLAHIEERRYARRFEEVIAQIESTGQPFLMPFRIRFAYDRVYQENVQQIGLLRGRLPALIPAFYIRLTGMVDDLSSMGDGTYSALGPDIVLRLYKDLHDILDKTVAQGGEIIAEIDAQYGTQTVDPGLNG